jgi:hypothetical protein
VTSLDNSAYVDPYAKMLGMNFPESLLQVPFSSEADLKRAIEDYKPEGLFCILSAKDLIKVLNFAKGIGRRLVIGSSSWGSTEVLALYSGPVLDGVLFFSLRLEDLDETYRSEIESFERRYDIKATNGTFYMISILHILEEALGEVGPSPVKLKAWFEEPRTYMTAYGELSMNAYGDCVTGRTVVLQTRSGVMDSIDIIEDRP